MGRRRGRCPGSGVKLGWGCPCRLAGGVHQPHLRVLAGYASAGPGRRGVCPADRHQHLLGRPAQRAGAQPRGGAAAAVCGGPPLLHEDQAAAGTGAACLPEPAQGGVRCTLGPAFSDPVSEVSRDVPGPEPEHWLSRQGRLGRAGPSRVSWPPLPGRTSCASRGCS